MKHCIRRTLGKNALPGHKYVGGCFHIRKNDGSWVQFGFGGPDSNRPDTEAQAYAKALAYCEKYRDEIVN